MLHLIVCTILRFFWCFRCSCNAPWFSSNWLGLAVEAAWALSRLPTPSCIEASCSRRTSCDASNARVCPSSVSPRSCFLSLSRFFITESCSLQSWSDLTWWSLRLRVVRARRQSALQVRFAAHHARRLPPPIVLQRCMLLSMPSKQFDRSRMLVGRNS
jgi:hypothetical protein